MIKKILFLLLFLIPLALAQPVVLPESQDIETFTNEPKELFVNITNPTNETMYKTKLSSSNSDLTFVDNDFQLDPQQSKQVKIALNTEDSYDLTSSVKVIYFSKVDVSLAPEDKSVDITNSGYLPPQLTIVKGSKVTWTNKDAITHSVTSDLFNMEAVQNESVSYTFSEAGIVPYHDAFTNLEGEIVVQDTEGEDFARDPQTDTEFIIHIKSLKIETVVELSFVDGESFTVNSNGNKDSVIKLKNIGDKSAQNITLSGEWLNFGKTYFSLLPSEETFVTFSILPQIISPNETNQTYNKAIIVKGSNFLQLTKNISIFVPFNADAKVGDSISRLFNQTLNEDFLIGLFNTICKAQPNFDKCKPQIVEKIVFQEKPLSIDFTEEEIKKIKEVFSLIERSDKDINTQITSLNEKLDTISNSVSTIKETSDLALQQEQENSKGRKFAWIIAITIGIIVLFALGGFIGWKYLKPFLDDKDGTAT